MRRAVHLTVGLAIAALLGSVAVDVANPPEINTISASYAFDMTDPNQVAGFADFVVLGRVLDNGTTVEWQEGIYTDFRIAVLGVPIKGQLPAEVVVRQLGGTLGEDTWVLEDQPRLLRGHTYVLVGGAEPGQETKGLGAGPLNVTDLTTAEDRRRATGYWTEAVRNQRWPDALR